MITNETRVAVTGAILDCLRELNQGAESDKLLHDIYDRQSYGIGNLSQVRYALAYAHNLTILRPGYDLTHKPLADDYRVAK